MQLTPARHLGQSAVTLFPWLENQLEVVGDPFWDHECLVSTVQGERHTMVRIAALPIESVDGFIVTLYDITEQKLAQVALETSKKRLQQTIDYKRQVEAQLIYKSQHDDLTGLYKRAYWQQAINQLDAARITPVALLLCDIDGLKFFNDTLGHDAGDRLLIKLADILLATVPPSAEIARIGGDEFAIILPHTGQEEALAICQAVREAVQEYNVNNSALPLSVSIGVALRVDPGEPMNSLFKRADDRMYREKLNRSQSARSALVQTLRSALEARDIGTEGHASKLPMWRGSISEPANQTW